MSNIDYFTPRRKKQRRWAWLRKFWADFNGYFWLPCPVCYEYFGGFEWKSGASINVKPLKVGSCSGKGICIPCFEEGRAEHPQYLMNDGITVVTMVPSDEKGHFFLERS